LFSKKSVWRHVILDLENLFILFKKDKGKRRKRKKKKNTRDFTCGEKCPII